MSDKTVNILLGYEGLSMWQKPFRKFLSTAAITLWRDQIDNRGLDAKIRLCVPVETYNYLTREEPEFCQKIDEWDLAPFAKYREVFGNLKYFGFPKFVAMSRSNRPSIIADLDVLVYNMAWFDLEKNWVTGTEYPEIFKKYAKLLSKLLQSQPDLNIKGPKGMNGGFYYIRDVDKVRVLGNILTYRSTVGEKFQNLPEDWVTLDEGILLPALAELKETYSFIPDGIHLHASLKDHFEGTDEEWKNYVCIVFADIQEKASKEAVESLKPAFSRVLEAIENHEE